MYRRKRTIRKMENMRAAKKRKHFERTKDEPIRDSVKGKLAYTITVEKHLRGEIIHVMTLVVSERIDQYRVEIDGKLWKKRAGISIITAGLRKAMPRFGREE